MLSRSGPHTSLSGCHQHKEEPAEQQTIVDKKIRMIHDQDQHAGHAGHRHVDQIHQHDRHRAWQEFSFAEIVCVARNKQFLPDARQMFRHGNGDASIEPLKERFHCTRLEHPEKSDEHQPHENGQGEGDNHDRLDRVCKGVDEFLDGQGDNQGKETDRNGIGENDGQDAPFEADDQPEAGQLLPCSTPRRLKSEIASWHRILRRTSDLYHAWKLGRNHRVASHLRLPAMQLGGHLTSCAS